MKNESRTYNEIRDPAARAAFARRLRSLRLAYGARLGLTEYTAKAFADALGISQERYGRYERGEMEPNLGLLGEMRRVTGASLCSLIAGEPAGTDTMIAPEGTDIGELQLGDRLRLVREILEPALERAARLMRVDPVTWAEWEVGADRPPVAKMEEFSHQFGDRHGVGLDFLYRGILTGVATDLLTKLMEKSPQLRATRRPEPPAKPHGQDTNTVGNGSNPRRAVGAR